MSSPARRVRRVESDGTPSYPPYSGPCDATIKSVPLGLSDVLSPARTVVDGAASDGGTKRGFDAALGEAGDLVVGGR